MKRDRSAVITGVSSGIGMATALLLGERGYRVFGSMRHERDATSLVQRLGSRFTPLVFDVNDEEAIRRASARVASEVGDAGLNALVNCAGIAVAGPLLHQDPAVFARHLEINVTGPFLVTRAFAPLLGAGAPPRPHPSRIVMVSSISGGLATPFLGAYAASKHALEAYSDVLRRELMPFGIDVVIVGPGAVATPIWDKADNRTAFADTPYAEAFSRFHHWITENGRKGLPPRVVAEVIADALEAASPKARYAVLRNSFSKWTLPRLLPRRVLDRTLSKRIGLAPRA
jgi:NAD(P)-dependent dehydrogenase (short-subunit alcohol dehydrogenase family)